MKSCVELLRSCEINILVVSSDIPVFCLDTNFLPLKTFELVTQRKWNQKVVDR